jgi:hypothetical protein
MDNWIVPFNGILTNDWINYVATKYGFFIVWATGVVYAWLKVIAIRNPDVESNGIIDLLKVIFKAPEEKK